MGNILQNAPQGNVLRSILFMLYTAYLSSYVLITKYLMHQFVDVGQL